MKTDQKRSQVTRPAEVHDLLAEHILADGLDIVLDLAASHGSIIHDALRGRDILDLFGCFSTIPIGYNHAALMEPDFQARLLAAAINKLSNSDIYTTEMADFVDAFARTLPESFRSHLFFISGGALAVENALKTAFDWKRQLNDRAGRGVRGEQVIHFEQAFHGRSGYTLSLTNTDPRKIRYFPKFSWPRIPNPRLSFPVTDEVLDRVAAAEAEAVERIKAAIVEHRHDIAALIIEPIQGEGGDNHFRREFLQELRILADESEFLLIFDEVQTGFATTGKWWCFEHFDVEPDIFAFGKKSQVCGIAANHRIDEVDSVFEVSSRINSTWGGNLVDMVRCQRIIEVIEQEGLLGNATEIGGEILQRLHSWEETYGGRVSNARGRGLFIAFDLATYEQRERLLRLMYEADVLGLRSGERAIRFRPALNLGSEDAREGLRRIERALENL